jgi:hypothetical protein
MRRITCTKYSGYFHPPIDHLLWVRVRVSGVLVEISNREINIKAAFFRMHLSWYVVKRKQESATRRTDPSSLEVRELTTVENGRKEILIQCSMNSRIVPVSFRLGSFLDIVLWSSAAITVSTDQVTITF